MSARIFAVANQKGGVGKTTTSVNLAAALALSGQRTLLIDLDPQGNATMGLGVDKRALSKSIYQVLVGLASAAEARVAAPSLEEATAAHGNSAQGSSAQASTANGAGAPARLDVLPANRELAGAEVELVDLERRELRLKAALRELAGDYDFILIDCPPSLSLLTLNGLCAAHGVIIPMQCEYYALEGLSDLVGTIRKVHANFNRDLELIGLLRVMYDPRSTLTGQVSAQLSQHFGDKVFRAIIPRNVRLAEAPSHGMPGVVFDRAAKGAQAYMEFAAELIERLGAGR
jgi:chromosome partitioning protein